MGSSESTTIVGAAEEALDSSREGIRSIGVERNGIGAKGGGSIDKDDKFEVKRCEGNDTFEDDSISLR